LAATGCDGYGCLRGKTGAEIKAALWHYAREAPIKLILTSDYYTPVQSCKIAHPSVFQKIKEKIMKIS